MRRTFVVPGFSVCAWVLVVGSYLARPYFLAALTIFPVWFWLFPGWLLAILCWWSSGLRVALSYATLVLVSVVLGCDELPGFLPGRSEAGANLRVVSYNWGGAFSPVEILRELKPDLILLQESPSRAAVVALASELKCQALWKPEASILSRYPLHETSTSSGVSVFCTRATMEIGRTRLHVASVRLAPPIFRFDLWSPSCWEAHAEHHLHHQSQLLSVMEGLEGPGIIAGDFNAPAGDGIFRVLRPSYRDAFRLAGRGFGNTAPAQLPVHRIDQIWATEDLVPILVETRAAPSDHRMVIADFKVP